MSTLRFALNNGIATITLHRPESSNRVNEEMATELRGITVELAANDDIRVVILTGTGPVFSTGRERPEGPDGIASLQVARAVADLPVPVLAALNGDASDHGLELALAADLRVSTAKARFWCSPPSPYNFPFDGGTQRLPRLVGLGWARDLLLTGRRLAAPEALSIGLVNRVAVDGEEVTRTAQRLASEIAEGSALGARYVKESVAQGSDLTLPQGLRLEADLNVILQSTADRAEGIASFLERRPPQFSGE